MNESVMARTSNRVRVRETGARTWLAGPDYTKRPVGPCGFARPGAGGPYGLSGTQATDSFLDHAFRPPCAAFRRSIALSLLEEAALIDR